MKYIDAEKLKAKIRQQIKMENYNFAALGGGGQTFCINTLEWVQKQIDSLQQEQPCDTCTNDKGCVTCKDGELWEGKEQPCEELKGKIREWVNLMVGASFPEQDGDFISEEDYRSVIRQTARHFYELGKGGK